MPEEVGASDFLDKPLTADKLRAIVAKYFQ